MRPVQSRAMGRVVPGFVPIAVLAIASTIARGEPRTWEYAGGGQWPQVNAATTQPTAADPTLDRIEQMLRAGQSRAAAKLDVRWLLSHKTHPQHDRGLFLLSQAWYQ